MIPRRIAGANTRLGPPRDWNAPDDGDCCALWVKVSASGKIVESAWEPTPDELAALNAGGSVILRIFGAQPPAILYATLPSEAAE